ncbi:ornithine cyclodeaminase family protein [Phenylobacterium sp.]|uniref:ornithine cyclodeaminase family protein n=1 Tax=Phenylobacterium sp. TaxID=1871053 RepID=UPI002FCC32DF
MNGALVRELLTMESCLPLMRRAHSMVARKEAVQPVRIGVRAPGVEGLLGVMPGYTSAPTWYGAKIISVFERNFGTAFGAHQGMVLLFDTMTGAPRAIIDATAITAIRTAASTAVATDLLARPDAASLGVFGYGEQAAQHVAALSLVRTFDRIRIWGRDPVKAKAFSVAQSARIGRPVEAVLDPQEAADSDVVCTTTSATEPFYQAEWLRAGQHLNLVGASTPREAEVEGRVIAGARCYYDSREGALSLSGEFTRAIEAGLIDERHLLGSVGEVIEGLAPGREGPGEITLFKSLGLVVQDIVAADFVLSEAGRLQKGVVIDW